jgi:N-acetylmuramoyl-L-alanine amidase
MKTMRRIVKSSFVRLFTAAAVLLLGGAFAVQSQPEEKKVKVVCIDPGHGGKDPGCHGDHAKEKDVALAVALQLGKYINEHFPDVKVVYTRKTDVFVELNERAAIANRNNADLFICIHCNSACVRNKKTKKDVCNETAEGSETYVMGLHKNNGNLEVAKRENDAALFEDDYQNKYNMNIASDEAMIILSTYQNLYQKQSTRFAELCQEQFSKRAGRVNKGVKQAGFLVLWKTSMPSVLIETGFLTNPAEERFLASAKGQTYMASSIFRAFRVWKDEVEGVKKEYADESDKPYEVAHEDTAGLRKPTNHITTRTNPATNNTTTTNTQQTVQPKDTATAKPASAGTGSVVYRVQILSSDKQLPATSSQFKGVTDTWGYKDKGVWKYTVGNYATQAEAVKRQGELRAKGFTGAFVVAFDENGNRITLEEAKKRGGA